MNILPPLVIDTSYGEQTWLQISETTCLIGTIEAVFSAISLFLDLLSVIEVPERSRTWTN